jgi:hypothetical protein
VRYWRGLPVVAHVDRVLVDAVGPAGVVGVVRHDGREHLPAKRVLVLSTATAFVIEVSHECTPRDWIRRPLRAHREGGARPRQLQGVVLRAKGHDVARPDLHLVGAGGRCEWRVRLLVGPVRRSTSNPVAGGHRHAGVGRFDHDVVGDPRLRWLDDRSRLPSVDGELVGVAVNLAQHVGEVARRLLLVDVCRWDWHGFVSDHTVLTTVGQPENLFHVLAADTAGRTSSPSTRRIAGQHTSGLGVSRAA